MLVPNHMGMVSVAVGDVSTEVKLWQLLDATKKAMAASYPNTMRAEIIREALEYETHERAERLGPDASSGGAGQSGEDNASERADD